MKRHHNAPLSSSRIQSIIAALRKAGSRGLTTLKLHRIGSGKSNGFCASLTRRISEIRDMGYAVICHKKTVKGILHTEYELI